MTLPPLLQRTQRSIGAAIYRWRNATEPRWECPLCGYHGPFAPVRIAAGPRPFAECPSCHARERHRLQVLVLRELFAHRPARGLRMLHVAPEPFLTPVFRSLVEHYETADLLRRDVDHQVDLCELPFEDASYDIVYASHVLEHVREDRIALAQIRRVLRPGGLAILPVPIVAAATIEYDAPNPLEENHVRAPGPDYFDRYRSTFSRVVLRAAGSYPSRYQCRIHAPPGVATPPQEDVVPICFRDVVADAHAWPEWARAESGTA